MEIFGGYRHGYCADIVRTLFGDADINGYKYGHCQDMDKDIKWLDGNIYIYIIIDIIINKNINMDIGKRMDILYGLLDSEFRGYYISPPAR